MVTVKLNFFGKHSVVEWWKMCWEDLEQRNNSLQILTIASTSPPPHCLSKHPLQEERPQLLLTTERRTILALHFLFFPRLQLMELMDSTDSGMSSGEEEFNAVIAKREGKTLLEVQISFSTKWKLAVRKRLDRILTLATHSFQTSLCLILVINTEFSMPCWESCSVRLFSA